MTVVAIVLVGLGMVLVGALAFADPVLLSWFERERPEKDAEVVELRPKEKQKAA
ncbi:hypothetical protein [Herbidospora sp. RD11066]